MTLESGADPDRTRGVASGPRSLVRGGVGHERLSPLVVRAQQGDTGAVSQVVSDLAPGVLRALGALLGRDHAELEDLAQEVLLAVIAALPDFRGDSTLLHFAVRIAARRAVTVRRRRRSVLRWLEDFWRGEHPLRSQVGSVHEQLTSERQRSLLGSLLAELPDAQAETLLLRVVCDYSLEEIASLTETPLNTVRSRLRLAKEALRKRIETEPAWAELGEEPSS